MEFEKGEKIEVASAYMPKEVEGMGENMRAVPANETPREELLLRDVGILLKECRELRAENKRLGEDNEILSERASILLEQNKKLFDSFQRLYKQNDELIAKAVKKDADL